MYTENIEPNKEDIMELPLSSEEIDILRDIYSEFVVELNAQDVSRPEALSAICKISKGVNPFWILRNFINIDEFQLVEEEGMIHFVFDEDEEVSSSEKEDEEISSPNNDEGGEKMEKPKGVTSGEAKIAYKILDHFGKGFKIRSPTVMTFMNCLETALPSINKKVDVKLAMNVMIRGNFLEIKEGEEPIFNFLETPKAKVVLGPEGEKYLSP